MYSLQNSIPKLIFIMRGPTIDMYHIPEIAWLLRVFVSNSIQYFSNSEQSMGLTKQMMAEVQQMSIVDALQYAAEQNAHARSTSDCKKGIEAFLKKEPIQW